MVPVNALEATSSTFVGHEWGAFWSRAGPGVVRISWYDLIGPFKISFRRPSSGIIRPALRSAIIALFIELPLLLFFSIWLVHPFARYLAGDDKVAMITTKMWRTIDWCYIFYALNTQLATILLATRPKWYLLNSLTVNLLWVLPWCIALQVGIRITEGTAWRYHAVIFGGSLVLSFWITLVILALWIRRLRSGEMRPKSA
jgi:Na+-driven multidrug efflux pump